ncbi:MAG: hypothetical protein P4L91_12840 [Burkholderiaceae bacterium]|nr:hypothetical protein [Burkholderiaceae bacterium]
MNTDNIYKPGNFKAEVPKSVHLVHKNGKHRIVPLGFCWAGFLLPTVWAISEGLWRPFAASLLFFMADKVAGLAEIYCEHGGFTAVIPYIIFLKIAAFASYVFTMGYFGVHGKELLIGDLLNHGYFVEGSPRPVEPDECES